MTRAETVTIEPEAQGRTQSGAEHDVAMDGFIRLAPKTHDISLATQHVPDIAYLASDLEKAVKAGWSRRHEMRYSKVHVLLLRWADDDLGVETELKDLQHVFEDLYHYAVELYDIPSQKPDKALTRRVLDFLDQDGAEALFILYYAGHGRIGVHSNEGPTWFANRENGSASLPSRGIQSKFEEADADVLFLYDCCNSAATASSSSHRGHKSVTEVIAACGYETIAPEVGEHSFSNALTETLAAASKGPLISVAELHARVLNRLKCWTPSFLKDETGKFTEDEAGRLKYQLQRRRTPIYGLLCETEPRRSIVFGPLSAPNSHSPVAVQVNPRKRKRSENEVLECPQILLAIRLDKHELDLQAWKECLLRQLPPAAKDIKIEGIYGSFSTLLLLRVPVIVWDLLPPNPAYSFVGFITTHNMAHRTPQPFHTPSPILSDDPSSEDLDSMQKEKFRSSPKVTCLEAARKSEVLDDIALRTDDVKQMFREDLPYRFEDEQSLFTEFPGPAILKSPKDVAVLEHILSKSKTLRFAEEPEIIPRHKIWAGDENAAGNKERRAGAGKVKSGCITCKARRVKCDEIKPHCLRCQRSGRICDGYLYNRVPGDVESQVSFTSFNAPSISSHDAQEFWYFQWYVKHAANELPGYFDTSFWAEVVVQESHNFPAMRHAVIALGALNKSLESAPAPSLKVNITNHDLPEHYYQYALYQYGIALELAKKYLSSNSTFHRNTLITYLLIICFESFQGSQTTIIQHLNECLLLLQSLSIWAPSRDDNRLCVADPLGDTPTPDKMIEDRTGQQVTSPPILHTSSGIDEMVIQNLIRFDGQKLFFGMTPDTLPLIWDVDDTCEPSEPSLLVAFPDFQSAHRFWDFLMDRTLQFYRRTLFNRAHSPSDAEHTHKIRSQYFSFRDKIKAFGIAFAPSLTCAISQTGKVINPAALVLSLYTKCTAILLSSTLSESESVFDWHLEDFQYIVRTCRTLLWSQESTQLPKNPRFSFDVGIVPPLHLTATKCRDPVVRREAVDMLFSSPRQEGMWDGLLCARIGRWIIGCEEEGFAHPLTKSPEAGDIGIKRELMGEKPRFDGLAAMQIMNDVKIKVEKGDDGKNMDTADQTLKRELKEGFDYVTEKKLVGIVGNNSTRGKSKEKAKMTEKKISVVPEENRVRLTEMDFHISERYAKVKCQKAQMNQAGTREEREIILAW
ncbi:hypothetical protein EG329_008742 [Mollisiaceae sp. DMI_Dod_QoI]|nr:hypothetical protein EG329_008742 [Helotiales sp. DMI_Dod_QoI]